VRRVNMSLGGLLPENEHRVACIAYEGEEASGGCSIVVVLPSWARGLRDTVQELAALYLAARSFNDSSAWAAYHLAALLLGAELPYTLAARLAREAQVNPYPVQPTDMAAYWRGKVRALLALDKLRMVLVKVEPPREHRAREKLRHILEGVTVTEQGRRRRSKGLVEKLGGRKVAPWLYLVPKTALQELEKTVTSHDGHIKTVYDPTTTAITLKQKSAATG